MSKRDEPTSVASGSERKSPSTSPLAPRDSLPSVESSLDAFIARANEISESPIDGSDALRRQIDDRHNGEQLLRRQNDDLRARLAETEARAARAPRRWPWVAGAFLVGAASMLAVSFVVPFTSRTTTTTTAASPPPAPPAQLQVTPISPEPPAVAQPADAAVATPPSPPVVVENTPTPLPTPHKSHAKPKAPKQDTPPPDVTKPPPEPPPKSDESGSGLYNPF